MRKLGISNSAIGQLKRLPAAVQQGAMDAMTRLQKQPELDVRMLSTKKAPDLLTYESGDLVFVLRQLRDRLIVLSIFSTTISRRNPDSVGNRRDAADAGKKPVKDDDDDCQHE